MAVWWVVRLGWLGWLDGCLVGWLAGWLSVVDQAWLVDYLVGLVMAGLLGRLSCRLLY